MILSRQITLDGVSLDGIHPAIVIRSIDPGAAQETMQTTPIMGGVGQRITSRSWNVIEVTVTYAINIRKNDLAGRRAVYDSVCAWAKKKGWLRLNFIPYRRLWVDQAEVRSMGDPRDWNGESQIIFRAYNVPFWQDEMAEIVEAASISSGDTNIHVRGNVDSPLDVSFTAGSSCANVGFSINGNSLTFNGVNLASGATLAITHGTDGLLRAMVGSTSVYDLMRGGDDLWAKPGDNALTLSASAAGTLTIRSYGRYA